MNKDDIRHVVKETVEEIFNNFVNIRSIAPHYPNEDFRGIYHSPTYNNPITLYINQNLNEGLLITYPIDKTIKYICNYFNFPPSQVDKIKGVDGTEKIAVSFYNIGKNVEIMSKAMDICGYYLSFPKESHIPNNEWVRLEYEPKFQNDITSDILANEKFLIHITPFYNVKKIKSIGFSPRYRNDMFNYPDRVYFVKGSTDEQIIINLANRLSTFNKSAGNNGEYALIKIDLNKISDNVKFYSDPNFIDGVYTKDNISPDVITDIIKIQTN